MFCFLKKLKFLEKNNNIIKSDIPDDVAAFAIKKIVKKFKINNIFSSFFFL